MTPELHTKIRDKLFKYLSREPSENEIQNGQTDDRLMGWIQEDDLKALKEENTTLKKEVEAQKLELQKLK
jgi:hypothetical protein